jgi:hypothetical protein
MSVGEETEQEPNAATLEILLETMWRVVDAEAARHDRIEGKATALASFASLVLSLTATLGTQLLETLAEVWAFVLYVLGLGSLAASVGVAIVVLLPRARVGFAAAHLRRFPQWSEITKPPEQVRGETLQGLVAMLDSERALNHRNARLVFAAFVLLFAGLVLVTIEAVAVAVTEIT